MQVQDFPSVLIKPLTGFGERDYSGAAIEQRDPKLAFEHPAIRWLTAACADAQVRTRRRVKPPGSREAPLEERRKMRKLSEVRFSVRGFDHAHIAHFPGYNATRATYAGRGR